MNIEVPSLGGPAWMQDVRAAGAERFGTLGLPTTRREDWRYTSLRRFRNHEFKSLDPGSVTASMVAPYQSEGAAACIVLVDGQWDRSLSTLPEGDALSIESFSDGENPGIGSVAPDDAPFVALNAASFLDGVHIQVKRGALIDGVVDVVVATTERAEANAVYPRVFVTAGAGSAVTIGERHIGFGAQPTLVSSVTEIVAGPDSNVRHVMVQEQGSGTFHFATIAASPQRGAQVEQHLVSLGALIARTAVHMTLGAEGSGCKLVGVFAATGAQSLDHYTVMDHVVGHCTSSEVYKGLVGSDDAVGSFLGRVFMRENAVGSATDQLCRALLLTKGATANVKPSLEIDNDDVTASHGAAIGRLDPDHLFYLRARGLTDELARALLIEAFVADVLNDLPVAGLGPKLAEMVAHSILPNAELEHLR